VFSIADIFIYIFLELRTFVLENRVKTFYAQCSQYQNEMVKEKSGIEFIRQLFDKYTLLTIYSLVIEIINVNTANSSWLILRTFVT